MEALGFLFVFLGFSATTGGCDTVLKSELVTCESSVKKKKFELISCCNKPFNISLKPALPLLYRPVSLQHNEPYQINSFSVIYKPFHFKMSHQLQA